MIRHTMRERLERADTDLADVLSGDAELSAALAAVRAEPGTAEATLAPPPHSEALARLMWARLVEPGDAIAGTLIRALGAVSSLELVAVDSNPGTVRERLLAAGECDVNERSVRYGLARWAPRLDRAALLDDLRRAARARMSAVFPDDPHWPRGLDDLGDHAPLMLWVRGDSRLITRSALAVVGARACTSYGSSVTADLTDDACAAGVAIVSGAAYGIDAVAHRTALAVGGTTIAVLAGGADRPYPAAHNNLLDRIAEQGVVCSEMVPGAAPTRWRFLQRNRIIAALAAGTLVTEAGVRSGSLNTAGHAAELGRGLGAVPGPITSAASTGCHRLIRDYGATLISNATELREFLGLGEPLSPPASRAGVEVAGAERHAAGETGHNEQAAECATRQPVLHRRLLDGLPLSRARSEEEAARSAGVSAEDARRGYAELEVLGFVRREETPDGGRAWRLIKRE